jgi:hypothetical protein
MVNFCFCRNGVAHRMGYGVYGLRNSRAVDAAAAEKLSHAPAGCLTAHLCTPPTALMAFTASSTPAGPSHDATAQEATRRS